MSGAQVLLRRGRCGESIDRSIIRSVSDCPATPRHATPRLAWVWAVPSLLVVVATTNTNDFVVSSRIPLMTTTGAAQSPCDWQDGQERADIELLQRTGRIMLLMLVRRCFEPSAPGRRQRRQRRRPDD
jgi:hypothetical protein